MQGQQDQALARRQNVKKANQSMHQVVERPVLPGPSAFATKMQQVAGDAECIYNTAKCICSSPL